MALSPCLEEQCPVQNGRISRCDFLFAFPTAYMGISAYRLLCALLFRVSYLLHHRRLFLHPRCAFLWHEPFKMAVTDSSGHAIVFCSQSGVVLLPALGKLAFKCNSGTTSEAYAQAGRILHGISRRFLDVYIPSAK